MAVGARIAAAPNAIRPLETRLRMAIVDFECMDVFMVEFCNVEMFAMDVCDGRSDLGIDDVNIWGTFAVRRGAAIMLVMDIGCVGNFWFSLIEQ